MRVWCAHCKRIQQVHIPRSRRRRVLETLAGRIGVCAVCGYPVTAIGMAMDRVHRAVHDPSLSAPRSMAVRGVS